MSYKKLYTPFLFTILLGSVSMLSCESLLGSKEDSTTAEIFEEGRIDPELEKVDGYAPVLPFWEDFSAPSDIYIGFDTFVYVTDEEGVHLLDRSDLSPRQSFPLQGASAVVQDRLLNIYVAARMDTVIDAVDPNLSWNLPVIYKIKNLNGSGTLQVVQKIVFPFDDVSLSTEAAKQSRLKKENAQNYELVTITGLTVMADNSIYVTRNGPRNDNSQVAAPDNVVLELSPISVNGVPTSRMRNTRQIRSLSPTTPSLLSAIEVSDIQGVIAPPQRDTFTDQRDFVIAQAGQDIEIPFRILWVDVEETVNGTEFNSRPEFLQQDTSRASGFLYEPFKFQKPSGIAIAGDNTQFLFVVDEIQNMLYQFQPNGEEGVDPPSGASAEQSRKKIIVSFGGFGTDAKQFNQPSGVAYFDRIVYVVDKGNNRISRFKLTSDFE